MGYTTDFFGQFTVTPPLKPEHAAYLRRFNETRRMARDADKAEALPDPTRAAAGLPIGRQGAYFVAGDGFAGQAHDDSVIDYNRPPNGQPGLWCQWTPTNDGAALEWDGGEKFYDYVEWLEYLVAHFLKPWGYAIEGAVQWQGEESDDRGVIYARGDQVEAVPSTVNNVGPSWGRA